MKTRRVIIAANSLLNIFKAYSNGDIPEDAKVVQFLLKPNERGKFAFVIESPGIKQGAPAINLNFRLKEIYGVGGSTQGE